MFSVSGTGLCRLERHVRSRSKFRLYLSMLLIASSANRSYHSNGAELGEGIELRLVKGESKNNSGELVKSCESMSPTIDFRATTGESVLADTSSFVDGVAVRGEVGPLDLGSAGKSFPDA